MIKKIPIAELKPGMFVHDVNSSWRSMPVFTFRHKMSDENIIDKIRQLGIREIYIDTTLGDDLPGAPTVDEVRRELEVQMISLAEGEEVTVHHRLASREELDHAWSIHHSASQLIQNIMHDVRMGRQIEFDTVCEALHNINNSVLASFGALMQLGQLKIADDYTFQHCVGVSALLTAFGKGLELNRQTIHDVGIGALLHDIGKMQVPLEILNKPGRLTDSEFEEIKQHVAYGRAIIGDASWISTTALHVLEQHHERYDGTGYPGRLKSADISPVGQMAAIVDVYDALTAERVYHKAMSPADALRKLQEWSHFHFNEDLVRHFIRNLGIYPLRTVVCLESGGVGIVIDQNPADLLRPTLLMVTNTIDRLPLTPYRLDLTKSANDRIVSYEDPEKYSIDVERYLAAA